jgi:hypothetical protein
MSQFSQSSNNISDIDSIPMSLSLKPTENPTEQLGKMEYHGPFGGTVTYHGHSLDNMKSCLQKYIRRGETEKAIRCALELELLSKLGDKTKGLRTNMINRLRIISGEEFADSCPKAIIPIAKYIANWERDRKLSLNQSAKWLICLIRTMEKIPKSRMVSFTRAAYKYAPLVESLKDKYKSLYDGIDQTIDIITYSNIKETDSDNLGYFLGRFIYHFDMESDKCFYWAFKIMDIKEKVSRRYRRTGAEYSLWEYLFVKFPNHLILSVYFNWYKKNPSEHWIYLITAIKTALNLNKNDLPHYQKIIETIDISDEEVEKIILDHMSQDFILDDYCIDKHTSEGRKKNRGAIHFAEIGSHVNNESPYVNSVYKNIYKELKYLSEGQVYNFGSVNTTKSKKKKIKKITIKKKKKTIEKKNKLQLDIVKKGLLVTKLNNESITNPTPSNSPVISTKKKSIKLKLKKKTLVIKKAGDNYSSMIEKISQEEWYRIQKLPHGQLKCGKHKKVVYIGKKNVYKGLYNPDDKSYINNIKFTHALEILENLTNREEKYRSLLKIEKILVIPSGERILVFKNVANPEKLTNDNTITKTSSIETEVNIYPRGIICRPQDMTSTNLTDEIRVAILQHLYFRHILHIGDSGPHNILKREDGSSQLIAGIDMEEYRTKDQGETLFEHLFRKRPSKRERELYGDYTNSIVKLTRDQILSKKSELEKIGINVNRILSKIM